MKRNFQVKFTMKRFHTMFQDGSMIFAWAKERAKQIHAYVKSAEESGRGVWELTEKGTEFYKLLIKQLERSVIVRKKRKNA